MAISLALITAVVAWQRRATPGATALAILMLGVVFWSLANLLSIASLDLAGQLFWANMAFIGVGLVPASWLWFALQYGQHPWASQPRRLAVLAIEPLLVLLVVWTNPLHQLFRTEVSLINQGGLQLLAVTLGPAFWGHTLYSYVLLCTGTFLLLRALWRARNLYRRQAFTLLLAISVPWLANIIFLSGLSPWPMLDLTPISFALSGVLIAWSLWFQRLLDVVPVARDRLVEQLRDGVAVIDQRGRVVDLNGVAIKTLRLADQAPIGRSAEVIFASWPGLLRIFTQQNREASVTVTLAGPDPRQSYEVRIAPLQGRHANAVGQLVIWHDVTARQAAEQRLAALNERLLLHVRDTPLAYIEWGRDLKVQVWNHAAEQIFGYPEAEVLGQRVRDLIVPERFWPQIDTLQTQLQAANKGGTRRTNLNRTRDGREIVCSWHNTVFTDPTGQVIGWASLVEDITEQTRTEADLAQANQSLHARVDELSALSRITQTIMTEPSLATIFAKIAEQLTDLLASDTSLVVLQGHDLTSATVVAHFDRAWTAPSLVGVAAAFEHVGEPLRSTLTRHTLYLEAQVLADIPQLLGLDLAQTGYKTLLVTPLRVRDHLHGWLISACLQADQLRSPEQTRLVETVASQLSGAIERMRLLELAELARDAAESASRARGQFFASMSHELRTPLNAILGYAQLLQTDSTDPNFRREALSQIGTSGTHLLHLITDLLDLARIEVGKAELAEGPTPLAPLLDAVAATIGPQAQRKALSFSYTLEPPLREQPLPEAFAVDGRRLRQILLALLSGSVATATGGSLHLHVSYHPPPQADEPWDVLFQIGDQGSGALTPFTRLAATLQDGTAAPPSSAGLGLAISLELLRLMHSSLLVSEPPDANSLSFQLHLSPSMLAPPTHPKFAPVPAAQSLLPEQTTLLIDGDPLTRAWLARTLRQRGQRVLETSDGVMGLSIALSQRPTAVIVDTQLMSHATTRLIRSLRTSPGLTDTIIVALTPDLEAAQSEALEAAGSNFCFARPLDFAAVLTALRPQARAADLAAKSASAPIQPPPPSQRPDSAQLAALHDLAVIGDPDALLSYADQLAAANPALAAFVAEVRQHAEQFAIDALLALLAERKPVHES